MPTSRTIFVGRRKESTSRVFIKTGNGTIKVNKCPLEKYFPIEYHRFNLTLPLELIGLRDKVDVQVDVKGGGKSGQSGAVRLAIARAIEYLHPEHRVKLKEKGYLTRDSRIVERKKYGRPKARKRFQFSKR